MLSRILNWFDARTGYRNLLARYTQRVVPDGPSWTRTTASCVLWMSAVVVLTGLILLTTYSPSTTSAWASVYYTQQSPAGHFLRGLHYFGGQCLLILFALHTIRVMLAAAYRSPRELVWVTGLLLIPLLMVWAVTGNPLPGTQKGLAQIEVEGNILGSTPVIGPAARRVLIGGDDVGNLTLTHLNSLHVALLPLLVGLLLVVHLHQVHRNANYADSVGADASDALPYWPHQTARNMVAFGIVFAVVAFLAYRHGAPLDTPADPDLHHIPRPEWYFLFLFELRRYFTSAQEIIATMIIPGAILTLLLVIPLLDWFCSKRVSGILRYGIVIAGLAGWGFLTASSMMRDMRDDQLQASRQHEAKLAVRARVLAARGIPPEGAVTLLQRDPKTQGPILFMQYCASCHAHVDAKGQGIASEKQSAPNLAGFASRNWVANVLTPEKFASAGFFGHTAFRDSEMINAGVTDHLEPDQVQQVIAALSAEAKLKGQRPLDAADTQKIKAGVALIQDEDEGCVMCHKFHDAGELGEAPDLTGYGSRAWLIAFISNPEDERFYRDANDRMPVFAPDHDIPEHNLLPATSIAMLADWLRGEWYEERPTVKATVKTRKED